MAEAELATIARPYARAVFSVALDSPEGLSAWSNRLNLLAGAASDEKLAEQLDDPKLSSAEASSLLASLFAEELNDTARNFLSVLASNGRPKP